FVTASAEARAERRLRELRERGAPAIYRGVLRDMKERDARDSGRRVAPLAAAPDAVTIDTTGIDADQVFEKVSDIIARALAAHRRWCHLWPSERVRGGRAPGRRRPGVSRTRRAAAFPPGRGAAGVAGPTTRHAPR